MNEKKSIFRKESLERVSSPEQLNDYIKVSRPGVWLIMAAVVALLLGVIVWSVFGTLTTSIDAVAGVSGGKAVCYVSIDAAEGIEVGMPLKIEQSTGTVTNIIATPMEVTEDFDAYARFLSGFESGDFVVGLQADIDVPDGIYAAKITVESVSPISFILN